VITRGISLGELVPSWGPAGRNCKHVIKPVIKLGESGRMV
jgi:hypothetical protein